MSLRVCVCVCARVGMYLSCFFFFLDALLLCFLICSQPVHSRTLSRFFAFFLFFSSLLLLY